MSDRNSILAKIRALLAKTAANGCTEAEAMAAFEMARKLMERHQIDMDEANTPEDVETKPMDHRRAESREIRMELIVALSRYTETRVWQTGSGNAARITICGLQSNVIFAEWLLEALESFIVRGANEYMLTLNEGATVGGSRASSRFREQADMFGGLGFKTQGRHYSKMQLARMREDYIKAAAIEIGRRLMEAAPKQGKAVELAEAAMKRNGIVLSKGRSHSAGSIDPSAGEAGRSRGQAAQFNRPVNAGGRVHAIGGR